MIKKLLFAILFMAISLFGIGQETAQQDTSYWLSGGNMSLTFSQVSLSDWAAGGENSTSVGSYVILFSDYTKKRHKWQNTADLAYGLLKQGNKQLIKSDDKLNFVTRYGYQIKKSPRWYFSTFLDFRSQFTAGFSQEEADSVISRFMAPGYFTIGTGLEFSPSKALSFTYVPVTGKITVVTDDRIVGQNGAYGVRPGENTRAELGSYFRFSYKQEPFTNVKVNSRLELFTNYEKRNFGNIDVNWQNNIIMKVNSRISTNFFINLIYDDDIKTERVVDGETKMAGPTVQFKSVFGVGLVYEFGEKRPKEK